jgi:hypothetical protein
MRKRFILAHVLEVTIHDCLALWFGACDKAANVHGRPNSHHEPGSQRKEEERPGVPQSPLEHSQWPTDLPEWPHHLLIGHSGSSL